MCQTHTGYEASVGGQGGCVNTFNTNINESAIHIQQLRGQKYIKEVVAKPGRRKDTVVEEEKQAGIHRTAGRAD